MFFAARIMTRRNIRGARVEFFRPLGARSGDCCGYSRFTGSLPAQTAVTGEHAFEGGISKISKTTPCIVAGPPPASAKTS
jgi:hypothetical protein